MVGDYSIIVHWRTASGEDRRVQTSASGYAKTEGQITSGGGIIYKITRVGGGKVTPPTSTAPAIVEDKVIAEVPPPPKPKPKPVEGETPFWYLTKYAEPRESERLQKLSTVPYFTLQWQQTPWKTIHQKAVQQAGEKAWHSLTPEEKAEFGHRYTEWESIPIEERKFYPGAEQHFESLSLVERETLTTKYIKEHPEFTGIETHEHIGISLELNPLKMVEDIGRRTSPKSKEEKAWEILTTPMEKRRSSFYASRPFYIRAGITGSTAFTSAALWPVTLSQTGVKLLTGKGDFFGRLETGKTLFLPDVGKAMYEMTPGGPSGVFSTLIGEGIAWGTGKSSPGLWEQAQKYPVEFSIGTIGEIAGLVFGGKAAKSVFGVGKYGFKSAVRYTPTVYAKYGSFIGRTPTFLEHGGRLLPKTIGTKIGQTKFYQHLHGWATGELVRVKTIPITTEKFLESSRTGVQEGPFTIAGKLTKYKGWGKTEWIPRSIAERYQIGEAISHSHLFRPDTYRGEVVKGMGTRSQIYDVAFMSKPKGFLWWKRGKIQTSSVREIEHVGTKFYPEILPSKYIGFDHSVARDFIKWYTTQMNKADPGHFVKMGFDRSVAYGTLKGHIVRPWKLYDEAAGSLTGHVPVTKLGYQPMVYGTKAGGYLGQPSISVPASSFSALSLSALGLGYGLSQVDVSAYGQRRDLGRVQQPDYASALSFKSAYDVLPVQATDMAQVQKQASRQASALLTETVSIPVTSPGRKGPHVPYRGFGPSVKIPKFILFDFEGAVHKKKKKFKPIDWTKGYRERTWKVLSMEDLLGNKRKKKRK